jgi:DNA repair exonuclease SbcCD ATPase subunit
MVLGWLLGKKAASTVLENLKPSTSTIQQIQKLEKRRRELLEERAELIARLREIDREIRKIEYWESVLRARDYFEP